MGWVGRRTRRIGRLGGLGGIMILCAARVGRTSEGISLAEGGGWPVLLASAWGAMPFREEGSTGRGGWGGESGSELGWTLGLEWALGGSQQTGEARDRALAARPGALLAGVPREAEPLDEQDKDIEEEEDTALSLPGCAAEEPGISAVLQAAWGELGLAPDQDRDRFRRIRLGGFLPSLTAGLSKELGDRSDYRYEPGSPRVDTVRRNDGWEWRVELRWDLSAMALRSEELRLARESALRSRDRLEFSRTLVRVYFARRRLLSSGLPELQSLATLKLQEANALLDAWTGGRFERRWCGSS